MANGYFERGEIYWVSISDMGGAEMGVSRPGLIVSSDEVNRTGQAIVVYLTTQCKDSNEWCVQTDATGRRSWIKCDAPITINNSRFRNFAGVVNSAEMRAVEDALEKVMSLGYVDDTALKEKESEIADRDALIGDLRNEVAGIRAEVVQRDETIASLKMEIEMWQKCYGRCMDMLVDVKVTGDVQRRTAVAVPVVEEQPKVEVKVPPVTVVEESPVPEEPPVIEEPPVTEDRLDINTATVTAMKKIGFSVSLARAVVAARPFESLEDLKNVPGMAKTRFRILEPRLWCSKPVKVVDPEEPVIEPVVEQEPVEKPKKPKTGWDGVKVNVNTVETITELQRRTGMTQRSASEIIRHREQFGDYEKLNDLLNLKYFGTIAMNRYGHMLEV